ncbi:hypothetical protein LINPERPRIM_LOCUS13007 [Linum perenne]
MSWFLMVLLSQLKLPLTGLPLGLKRWRIHSRVIKD